MCSGHCNNFEAWEPLWEIARRLRHQYNLLKVQFTDIPQSERQNLITEMTEINDQRELISQLYMQYQRQAKQDPACDYREFLRKVYRAASQPIPEYAETESQYDNHSDEEQWIRDRLF
jgi:hypothetical protein